MNKIFSALLLATLAACATSNDTQRIVAAAQSGEFVGGGEPGRSKLFGNVVTVYKRPSDPQPRCLGCANFRLVVDNTPQADPRDRPIGGTVVSQVRFNASKVCPKATSKDIGKAVPLAPTNQSFWAPIFTSDAPAMLTIPSACLQGGIKGTVTVELLKLRCMNPMAAGCKDLVVAESFEVAASDLFALKPYTGDDQPNKLTPAAHHAR